MGADTNDSSIDHINMIRLDNQKKNLRFCTQSQNMANQGKPKHGHTSKYKGVFLFKRDQKWAAQICVNKKRMHIGYFDNEDSAAQAYNEAAQKHFGEFANLNRIAA